MTDPLPDTWHHRDLPVLREVVRLTDERMGQIVKVEEVEAALDLGPDNIQRAGLALKHAGLCKVDGALQRRVLMFSQPTADARRYAGSWPTPESAADRIVRALEAIAEHTDDEDTRTNARRTVDWLRRNATTVGVTVASAAITGQIPGAGA